MTDGDLAKGYFCAPTMVDNVPLDHRLWGHEMFVPITMVTGFSFLGEGMEIANSSQYGLMVGFYGSPDEVQWFLDSIQVGVSYSNRPQGSTTGAWPGYQSLGGWKSSGATGKNAFGPYYVPLHMDEQSRTVVRAAR